MTFGQFLGLGEDPDGIRLELVDGEIEMSPSPLPRHSHVVSQLNYLLIGHMRSGKGGQILNDSDTVLNEHNVRRPDLAWFSAERKHLVRATAVEGPPDLAVEIVSPTSVKNDREIKFKGYAEAGIEHYWIIDPQQQTFESFHLRAGRYEPAAHGRSADRVHPAPFENLGLNLSELWLR